MVADEHMLFGVELAELLRSVHGRCSHMDDRRLGMKKAPTGSPLTES